MPESPGNIEEIHNSLKASLNRGNKQQDLDKDVVAASKRVLLEHISFEPASAPYTMQLDQLRAKYISLNAGTATAASTSVGNSSNSGSEMLPTQHGNILLICRALQTLKKGLIATNTHLPALTLYICWKICWEMIILSFWKYVYTLRFTSNSFVIYETCVMNHNC